MLHHFLDFKNDEDGAVTVDFVVLTAAIVILGFMAMTSISGGVQVVADSHEEALTNRQLGPSSGH